MSQRHAVKETSVMQAFSILPDPRKTRNQAYSVSEIVSIAILAVLCGADDWVEISLWAESNLEWLRELQMCLEGAPSHDTLSRFFRYVNPQAFERCFINWTQHIAKSVGGVIALDGKTLCNSADPTKDARAIHLVSAFAAENQLVLGQLATEAKSNEITAFPLLLALLDVNGAIVTIDAGGCHKPLAKQIIEQGGNYVIGLKGNQGNLHAEARNFFVQAIEIMPEEAGCDYYVTEEKSRGRVEKREVWATENLEWLPQRAEWSGLRSLVAVRSTRTIKDVTSIEIRYYISSLPTDARKAAQAIRAHWSIENQLHWQLDVSYGEDGCKVRKDNGAENFSVLRRATLNILKGDKKTKAGIKNRRSKAGWNRGYLKELLGVN
jgi:predicted transposase YbfD/YdcC